MSTPWLDGQPAGVVGKIYADNPWDTMFIGGAQMPGLVKVNVKAARRVDSKPHAGADGETLTIHGRNRARVEIRVRVWTPDQDKKMDVVLSKVWAQYGKTGAQGTPTGAIVGSGGGGIAGAIAASFATTAPLVSGIPVSSVADQLAFDVVHPKFSKHGIKSITVVDVDGPDEGQGAEWSVLTYTLRCLEFMPVEKAKSKPATPRKPVATTQNLQTLNTANPNPNATQKNAPKPDPSQNPQDTGPNFTPASGQSGPT